MFTAVYHKGKVKLSFAMFSVDPFTQSKYYQCFAAISSVNDRRDWNMFWKSQPEYKVYCKCHDEQFHFSNLQDDMIEKTEQVVIIRRIQVIFY